MARRWTSQAVLDLGLTSMPPSLELCRGPPEGGRCLRHGQDGPWEWPSAAIPEPSPLQQTDVCGGAHSKHTGNHESLDPRLETRECRLP